MSNEEEKIRIEQNLQVIREYLIGQFKGFELTKDRSDGSLDHWFTMTDTKSGTQYTLKVLCLKLSDRDKSPEKIKRQLDIEEVANKMRAAPKGKYFRWGNF